MSKPLTAAAVAKIKPTAARQEIPDGRSGLYLVVQPSGRKSWAFRYAVKGTGERRKLTLGRVLLLSAGEVEPPSPGIGMAMTLRAARERVAMLKREVSIGKDPAEELQREKAALAAAPIFDDVLGLHVGRYVRVYTRENTAKETERLFRRHVLPAWSGRRLADITRKDFRLLLESIAKRAATSSNRTRSALSRFFKWCLEQELVAVDPTAGVKPLAPERERERVLSDYELSLIWRAADAKGGVYRALFQLLILTGQRKSEVAKMRWSEIDLEKGVWTLTGARTKNSNPHMVPLSSEALAIIEALPRHAGEPDYVLSSGPGFARDLTTKTTSHPRPALVPISGFSKAKAFIERKVEEIRIDDAIKAGLDPSGLKPIEQWGIHDFRRTMTTGLAALGTPMEVTEKSINHLSGSFKGVARVYQRHSYWKERCDAYAQWAAHVRHCVDHLHPKPAGSVVD